MWLRYDVVRGMAKAAVSSNRFLGRSRLELRQRVIVGQLDGSLLGSNSHCQAEGYSRPEHLSFGFLHCRRSLASRIR